VKVGQRRTYPEVAPGCLRLLVHPIFSLSRRQETLCPVTMAPPVVPHLIDGKDVPASDGATYDVFNPLTDEVLYRASAATVEDTNAAIETAHKAWKEWKKWGPSRRRLVLLKAADILESRKEEASKLLSEEVSAMPAWATVNVMAGAAILRESAALATHIKGEVVPADRPGASPSENLPFFLFDSANTDLAGTMIMVLREPAGVVFSMAPWNVRRSTLAQVFFRC
jgi:acyl-CoA reductase-like NAD-dependent aldehyde dehydrogenase